MERMTIGKFIISSGAAVAVLLVGTAFYALNQSDDGQPIIVNRSELTSPDGTWVATLEAVDNGLGFGQGVLYDEVHIRRPNESIPNHGDSARSAVFFIDAMGASGEPPYLTWRDATHLIISYDTKRSNENGPGKCLRGFHGISIDCRPK
jgi:hypothetical protein